MSTAKAHIISQLQKEILLLQGFKPAGIQGNDGGLSAISQAFPNNNFPLGAIHEFFCNNPEQVTACSGFISCIVSSLMKKTGASVWISSSQNIFPPSLKSFGIKPEQIIFIQTKNEKQKLWIIEEALKCDAVSAVVSDISEISFTDSRRMQLAAEQSGVTAFLLRQNPKNLSTACVTRWNIKPLGSSKSDLPGIGFPRWNVELLKVRNGKPGSWQMEWKKGKLRLIEKQFVMIEQEQRKIV